MALSLNSLILTREGERERERAGYQRERRKQPIGPCLLTHSLFFLSFSFLFFFLFLHFSFVTSILPLVPPTVHSKGLFYTACCDGFLLFYPLIAFVLVWASFPDHPLVYRLPSHHRLPILAVPHSIPRQKSFVLFSCSLWHSHHDKGRYSLLLTLWHGPSDSNLSFPFWVVCHPSKTFFLKGLEQEPQNRLSPSPHHQTLPTLTSDPWPTTLVLAEYKQVVPESYAYSTSMCIHGLSAIHVFAMTQWFVWPLLHILLLILDFLWRECIINLPFFMPCFLPGLGLAQAWTFPSSF